MQSELQQVNNVSKFKILQSSKMIGKELDVANVLHLFDPDEKDGKRPTIIRTFLSVNGNPVYADAQSAIDENMGKVESVAERCKVFSYFIPLIPRQVAFLYGKQNYKASTLLCHMQRGNDPEISKPALQRANEAQYSLLRMIVGAKAEYIPDALGPHNPFPPHPSRSDISISAPTGLGGLGWQEATSAAHWANAARVVDTHRWLEKMPWLEEFVLPPSR